MENGPLFGDSFDEYITRVPHGFNDDCQSHDQGCPPKSLSIRYPVIPQRSHLYSVALRSKCRTAPREPLECPQGLRFRGRKLAHAELPAQGP